MARFQQLARDHGRLPEALAGRQLRGFTSLTARCSAEPMGHTLYVHTAF